MASMPTTGMQRGYSVMLDSQEALVLTPKNVQAFRTLFNIAHRLDNLLDRSAWVHIAETIDALDRILQSPKATTQEVSQGGAMDGPSSDLAILAAAAKQLFSSTPRLSNDAVLSLMMALAEVSGMWRGDGVGGGGGAGTASLATCGALDCHSKREMTRVVFAVSIVCTGK